MSNTERVPMPDLVRLARAFYEKSFALTDDEESAYRLCDYAAVPGLRLEEGPWDSRVLNNIDLTNARWAARWYANGLPRVRLRATRAASLAATAIPLEHIADVRPPWHAFIIHVDGADDFLTDPRLPGVGFDQLEVLYAIGRSGKYTWSFFARARHTGLLWRVWVEPDQWSDNFSSPLLFDEVPDPAVERLLQVLGRIVLGSCVALAAPEILAAAGARGRSRRFRQRGVPLIRDFVVTNDVRVDVRRGIADYVAHGGSPPTVQSLVRGHWKHQVHGPAGTLRRWQHIEPYWRGPEDAPVALRTHRLG